MSRSNQSLVESCLRKVSSCAARMVLLIACAAAVTNFTGRAAAQTWGQRLGYGADKRVVILHASGAGICYESNAAVSDALATGAASSGAVMATCPWFEDFAAGVAKMPDADIGLTITYTSEFEKYRWTTVTTRSDVPGLIDTDGYLRRSVAELVYNTTPQEVARELDAQLNKARAAGLRPTHLTCHQGVVFARADLAAVYLEAARRHWIPAVVIELTPQRLRQFHDEGFPLDDEMLQLVANYPLPKIDDIRLVPNGDTYEEKRERFLKQISELQPGITQFVSRPAVESEALKRITSNWQQSAWDAQLLADPKVKEALAKQGVVLTGWREIMRRFEGEKPAATPKDKPAVKSDLIPHQAEPLRPTAPSTDRPAESPK